MSLPECEEEKEKESFRQNSSFHGFILWKIYFTACHKTSKGVTFFEAVCRHRPYWLKSEI
jgi:hypothetical protein